VDGDAARLLLDRRLDVAVRVAQRHVLRRQIDARAEHATGRLLLRHELLRSAELRTAELRRGELLCAAELRRSELLRAGGRTRRHHLGTGVERQALALRILRRCGRHHRAAAVLRRVGRSARLARHLRRRCDVGGLPGPTNGRALDPTGHGRQVDPALAYGRTARRCADRLLVAERALLIALGAGDVGARRGVADLQEGLDVAFEVEADRSEDRRRPRDERADLGNARRELHVLEHVEVVRLHGEDRKLLQLRVELHREHAQLRGELVRDELEQRVVDRRALQLLARDEVRLVVVRLELEQLHLVEQAHLNERFLDVQTAALGVDDDAVHIRGVHHALCGERIEQLGVDARSGPRRWVKRCRH
jgi:hypothetical protein